MLVSCEISEKVFFLKNHNFLDINLNISYTKTFEILIYLLIKYKMFIIKYIKDIKKIIKK